jgi:hypothetical protein
MKDPAKLLKIMMIKAKMLIEHRLPKMLKRGGEAMFANVTADAKQMKVYNQFCSLYPEEE